jgi:C-terminal processing protease CtpA/Prc
MTDRWRSTLLAAALGLALPSAAVAGPGAPASDDDGTLATFEACLRTLRATPYLRTRDDLDWRSIEDDWRSRADAAAPGDEVREVLNEMLIELDASHAAVLDGAVHRTMMNELNGRPSPTFGVLLEESRPGRLFVRALFEGGPAERAGLALGDEVVVVDGAGALESGSVVEAGYDPGIGKERLFSLRAHSAGTRCSMATRRAADARLTIRHLVAESMSGLEAGRRSARVVDVEGRRIGVFHLWMVALGSAELLQEALTGPLADCEALVFDLRGRGGFADEIPGLLAPFRKPSGRRAARGVHFDRPVVFLTDDRTRSAKEILSWHIRHERLGPLVGEATEGAVLGAGFFPLPGGLLLEAPVMEVPMPDGTSLEGVGVEPHIAVERAGPFAAGRDPILARGLAEALRRLSAKGARRRPI